MHLARGDQRDKGRIPLRAVIAPAEQPVFPAYSDLTTILPISGTQLSCITHLTRFTANDFQSNTRRIEQTV
jgi:hypothetical protein